MDLDMFKTQPCKLGGSHNPKKCLFYHDSKRDRRRPLGTYQSDMCQYVAQGRECPFSDACQKAHNRVEEFYYPEKYKIKFCSKYPDRVD